VTDGRGRSLQFRVGIFILAGLGALLAIGYLLGAQARYFEPKYSLIAEFTEVGGLLEGATVRLAGVQIGRVADVVLAPEPGGKVRVTLRIARQFSDRIRRDSEARIMTQGLLGDKLIEITVGTSGQPPLRPGETIATRDPFEPSRVFAEGAATMAAVSRLAASLTSTLERLEREGTFDELGATVRSARRATEQLSQVAERMGRITAAVETGKGWLHTLVYEEPATLRRLDAVLESTRNLMARAETGDHAVSVLLSPESARSARAVLEAMDSVARSARNVEAGVGTLKQGIDARNTLLSALLFDPQYRGVVDDLQAVTRNFRAVSEKLANGQGLLGELLHDGGEPAGLDRAAADLRAAMANLRAVTERIRSGDGTVGALIEDPTVYEGLVQFLEGARRSFLLRSLIRSTIESAPRPAPER
jgi:phospholipid/cholesterol/gamma-HCH transport system substrate-binding protein